MQHSDRTWVVIPGRTAELLATDILLPWPVCQGFAIGDYLFLNDSTGEEDKGYAVLKRQPDGQCQQATTLVFDAGEDEAMRFIGWALAGKYDNVPNRLVIVPTVQTPSEHGSCPFCV